MQQPSATESHTSSKASKKQRPTSLASSASSGPSAEATRPAPQSSASSLTLLRMAPGVDFYRLMYTYFSIESMYQIWGGDKWFFQHIKDKYKRVAYAEGTQHDYVAFYMDLDQDNRELLLRYLNDKAAAHATPAAKEESVKMPDLEDDEVTGMYTLDLTGETPYLINMADPGHPTPLPMVDAYIAQHPDATREDFLAFMTNEVPKDVDIPFFTKVMSTCFESRKVLSRVREAQKKMHSNKDQYVKFAEMYVAIRPQATCDEFVRDALKNVPPGEDKGTFEASLRQGWKLAFPANKTKKERK